MLSERWVIVIVICLFIVYRSIKRRRMVWDWSKATIEQLKKKREGKEGQNNGGGFREETTRK